MTSWLRFPLAGVPRADGHDGGDPRRDGGEQQVLPLRPLPLRRGGGEIEIEPSIDTLIWHLARASSSVARAIN